MRWLAQIGLIFLLGLLGLVFGVALSWFLAGPQP